MSQVNILVAVNVSEAISSGNLGEYIWMIDTKDYSGTTNKSEATNHLHTHVKNGDTIVWTVVPIDPNDEVSILGFWNANSGENTIPDMINPGKYPQFDGTVWGGRVNKTGTNAKYSMNLLLGGTHHMTFDPFITSTNRS